MLEIKVTPSTLRSWIEDEEGSHADHGCPAEGHVYNVLTRHKGKLVMQDAAEVRLVLESAGYRGDVYGWDDRPSYRRAVARIADEIKTTIAAKGQA